MAKRFTSTEKWEDLWFSELPNIYKLFWIYLLDKCDNAGIWEKNFKVASFFLGEKIEEQKALEVFGNKIILQNGNKWFIPKFIQFQYGTLTETSNPHKPVIEKLTKLGLYKNGEIKGKNTLLEIPKGVKDKEEDIEQDKDKALVKEQDKDRIELIFLVWNNFAKTHSLSELRVMTSSRKTHLKLRLKNINFNIYKILEVAEHQPFLFGENKSNWKMSFDWLVKNEENYLKVLEGNYKSNKQSQTGAEIVARELYGK